MPGFLTLPLIVNRRVFQCSLSPVPVPACVDMTLMYGTRRTYASDMRLAGVVEAHGLNGKRGTGIKIDGLGRPGRQRSMAVNS